MNDLLPTPADRDLSPATHARIKRRVLDEITPPTDGRVSPPRAVMEPRPNAPRDIRPHRRALRALAAAALPLVIAAAVVVIAAAVVVVQPSGIPNASATLLKLSASVGASWESPTKGQYIYTESVGKTPSCDRTGCVLQDFTRQSWIARDGSGRIIESIDGSTSDKLFAPGDLPYDDFTWALGGPGFDSRLRDYVVQHMATDQPADFAMFVEIGKMLGEAQAIPEARTALLRLAATLPNTELLGVTTDDLGRSGIGIGYTADGIRHEVIFDQGSAIVLEVRDVTVATFSPGAATTRTADDVFPGAWTAYSSALVASVKDVPNASRS